MLLEKPFRHIVRITHEGIPLSVLIVFLFSSIATGCGSKASSEEKRAFAQLYAELLIAENMYRNDSARQQKVADSILRESEFENVEEVRGWLRELTTNDPQGVQEVMDSTQKYLERVRDRAENGSGNMSAPDTTGSTDTAGPE